MRWTQHSDARVRYEAIRLQLTLPEERSLALRAAIDDLDLRIMRLGLVALQQDCPASMASLVAKVALDPRIVEELRVHAVRALARSREHPALEALRRRGIRCEGPFAADGFFASPPSYDAVICPYHDQGLIPFKMLARDRGCQLSAGLPLLRTSPDHGSALDIAGRGIANPGSMRYALALAVKLARP